MRDFNPFMPFSWICTINPELKFISDLYHQHVSWGRYVLVSSGRVRHPLDSKIFFARSRLATSFTLYCVDTVLCRRNIDDSVLALERSVTASSCATSSTLYCVDTVLCRRNIVDSVLALGRSVTASSCATSSTLIGTCFATSSTLYSVDSQHLIVWMLYGVAATSATLWLWAGFG